MPKGWATVGRLRVACFLVGFFRTMVQYMETEDYAALHNWRNNLLHTDVANPGKEFETRTNAQIKMKLAEILTPSITSFLEHPVTNTCLSEMKNADLPFLLIIDEATYLHQTNYMHSFMWVLDEPVVAILKTIRMENSNANRFFILLLGTHSQLSHFAPDYTYPSERYFDGLQSLPSVFLSLD